MDPVIGLGRVRSLSMLDIQVTDVIGWDRHGIPEPSSLTLLGLAFMSLYPRCAKIEQR